MLELISALEPYNKGLSSIAYIVGIAGFVPADITFVRKTLQEIKEKEEKIYLQIDEATFQINKLILAHPQLGVSWWQDQPTRPLSEEELVQQAILFDMLTALFERTFLVYQEASSKQRHAQWAGWEQFMLDYCRKQGYRNWWNLLVENHEGPQYDKRFVRFMNEYIKRCMVSN